MFICLVVLVRVCVCVCVCARASKCLSLSISLSKIQGIVRSKKLQLIALTDIRSRAAQGDSRRRSHCFSDMGWSVPYSKSNRPLCSEDCRGGNISKRTLKTNNTPPPPSPPLPPTRLYASFQKRFRKSQAATSWLGFPFTEFAFQAIQDTLACYRAKLKEDAEPRQSRSFLR